MTSSADGSRKSKHLKTATDFEARGESPALAHARADFIAAVDALLQERRPPGRPRKGDQRTLPKWTEINAASQNAHPGEPSAAYTTIRSWLEGDAIPTHEKLASVLLISRKHGREAVDHLVNLASGWLNLQAQLLLEDARRLLSSEEVAYTRIKVTIEAETVTMKFADEEGKRAFEQAKNQMVTSRSHFGWLTHTLSGYQIFPNPLVCDLLGIPQDKLYGSYLIDAPLIPRLEQILDNFGEYILTLGMLAHPVFVRWQDEGQDEYAQRAEKFFQWIANYVNSNYSRVVEQLYDAPEQVADAEPRTTLFQCLLAATGESNTSWPAYTSNRWNSIPIVLGQHPLLPKGEHARFLKNARPVSSEGFEVTVEAEDETAFKLLQDIRKQLKG